jgi:hypothetical protein
MIEEHFMPPKVLNRTRKLIQGNEAALLEALRSLEADKYSRLIRTSSPSVITFESDDDLGMVPPGSVTLFMAPKGSSFLASVQNGFERGDVNKLQELANQIGAEGVKRKPISLKRAAADLIKQRVYADVRYGSETLAENLGLVNGIDYGILSFPYNGGPLNIRDFSIVEYFRDEQNEFLESVLVIRPPKLSPAEKKALELVPPELRGIHIGSGGTKAVTVTTVTILLFVVAVHTPTLTGGLDVRNFRDRLDRIQLTEDRIRELGPIASARELLNLRQQVFAEQF